MTDNEIALDIIRLMREKPEKAFSRDELAILYNKNERYIRWIISEVCCGVLGEIVVNDHPGGYRLARSKEEALRKAGSLAQKITGLRRYMTYINRACRAQFGESNKEAEQLELI